MLFMAMHKHGAERVWFVLGIFESLYGKLMYLWQNMTDLLNTMNYIYPQGLDSNRSPGFHTGVRKRSTDAPKTMQLYH